MINRILSASNNKSFFLFGARGTGKSHLLRSHFSEESVEYIDLLEPQTFQELSIAPQRLHERLQSIAPGKKSWVILDEVQRIPRLLDIVHQQLAQSTPRWKFALTGSSARKLRRGQANLLAGRAHVLHLFPLTTVEAEPTISWEQLLTWGGLPECLLAQSDVDRMRYLRAYTHTYLQQEIMQEQVVRRIEPFQRFLPIAAQANGTIVNFSNIARDVGVSTVTVQTYFDILIDTLVGVYLPAYHQSIRKRQRQNPKFYFFDTGVVRALSDTLTIPLQAGTYAYGRAFEHFLTLEIIRRHAYAERDFRCSYLRTKDDAEIDLIIERPGLPIALVEIKSGTQMNADDVRQLVHLGKAFGKHESYCLSNDPVPKIINGVQVLPWGAGMTEIT